MLQRRDYTPCSYSLRHVTFSYNLSESIINLPAHRDARWQSHLLEYWGENYYLYKLDIVPMLLRDNTKILDNPRHRLSRALPPTWSLLSFLPWACLCQSSSYSNFPRIDSAAFKTIDSQLSQYWKISLCGGRGEHKDQTTNFIAYIAAVHMHCNAPILRVPPSGSDNRAICSFSCPFSFWRRCISCGPVTGSQEQPYIHRVCKTENDFGNPSFSLPHSSIQQLTYGALNASLLLRIYPFRRYW